MTASISLPARAAGHISSDSFAGFGPLFRKELGEWAHGKRIWVILASTTAFMTLVAANGAITSWMLANVPGGEAPDGPISLDTMFNFLKAVSTQFFAVVAIFAAMSLLVSERDRGTLAWVASKPVSRAGIWLSKWTAASIVVSIAVGIIPLAASFGLAIVLYGPAGFDGFVFAAIGVTASITFMIAVVLAASVVVSNQAAVASIGFAVLLLPPMLAGMLPVDVSPVLPSSILPWALSPVIGAEMGFVTPIAWAVSVIALVGFASLRMDRIEF
jgi:ABC-type transport system involved in multi-copper enzyme maturation permease subunit